MATARCSSGSPAVVELLLGALAAASATATTPALSAVSGDAARQTARCRSHTRSIPSCWSTSTKAAAPPGQWSPRPNATVSARTALAFCVATDAPRLTSPVQSRFVSGSRSTVMPSRAAAAAAVMAAASAWLGETKAASGIHL
jgi:hypothetical protein